MLTPAQAQKLASDLLDNGEAAPFLQEIEEPKPPEQIGGYRIVRQIATGGMGTVYEAVQEHPHRTVALKVLRPGIISRETLRRFHYEAEVLGRLQHPGIAQVYAAGTHDDGSGGVPYFVMEYLPNALPITEFAERNQLSVRERLDLFAQVSDAVHYGHQKGFIHRDLKPANILVTSEGIEDELKGIKASGDQGIKSGDGPPRCPAAADLRLDASMTRCLVKVIDFGIARATDSDTAVTTMVTDARELIGTLQYMSPEQCEGNPGELDVRSDVYSLGVVLYELLCGQLPYDVRGTTIAGAAKMIQQQDPPRPSAIIKRLRGDVETIVLIALDKDRTKRYQCALVLAEDIRRYLRGEPIEARKPTAWTKTMRWAARHPRTASGMLCGAMLTVTVAAIALGHWRLNLKPDRIALSADRLEAHLLSWSGAPLRNWNAGGKIGFQAARFVPRSQRLAHDMVLLDYQRDSELPEAGSIQAYAVDESIIHPRWEYRIRIEDVPPNLRSSGADFDSAIFYVGDVLSNDQNPGDEVICTFAHHSSALAICVLDLDSGRLLYRAWHDGILELYWLAQPRFIIASGFNTEVYARQRGYPHIERGHANHPTVVLALRPTLGHLATTCSTPYGRTGDKQEGETTTLAWYWALPGPSHFEQLGLWHGPTAGPPKFPRDQFFQLHVFVRNDDKLTASFILNAQGEMISRWCGDTWRNNPGAPPTSIIEAVELVQLPPAVE